LIVQNEGLQIVDRQRVEEETGSENSTRRLMRLKSQEMPRPMKLGPSTTSTHWPNGVNRVHLPRHPTQTPETRGRVFKLLFVSLNNDELLHNDSMVARPAHIPLVWTWAIPTGLASSSQFSDQTIPRVCVIQSGAQGCCQAKGTRPHLRSAAAIQLLDVSGTQLLTPQR